VMMPVMAHNVLEAMSLLEAAVTVFTRQCVAGIRADAERCRHYFERSPSLATALTPLIGYARAAELAKRSLETGKTIVDLALEERLLDRRAARRALDPVRLTRPGILGAGPARRLRPRRGRGGPSARSRRG